MAESGVRLLKKTLHDPVRNFFDWRLRMPYPSYFADQSR